MCRPPPNDRLPFYTCSAPSPAHLPPASPTSSHPIPHLQRSPLTSLQRDRVSFHSAIIPEHTKRNKINVRRGNRTALSLCPSPKASSHPINSHLNLSEASCVSLAAAPTPPSFPAGALESSSLQKSSCASLTSNSQRLPSALQDGERDSPALPFPPPSQGGLLCFPVLSKVMA